MKYIILFFFLLTVRTSWSKSYKFGLQWGLGSYSMTGLKGINESAFQRIPFSTQLVSDFPSYFYYRPSILWVFEKQAVGLVSTFQSTGSRISGKDYSGEYRFDMTVHSNCPGIYYERTINTINKVQLSFSAIVGCSLSKLTINEYSNVLDIQISEEDYQFQSLNFYCEPGFNLSYPMKSFSVGINVGYFVSFGNQAFYTDNNKDHILADSKNNSPITPEWNGWRVGLSLDYRWGKK